MLECQHFLRRARTTPHSSHLPQTRNTLKHSVTAKKIYRNSQFESEFLGLPSQGLLTLKHVTQNWPRTQGRGAFGIVLTLPLFISIYRLEKTQF